MGRRGGGEGKCFPKPLLEVVFYSVCLFMYCRRRLRESFSFFSYFKGDFVILFDVKRKTESERAGEGERERELSIYASTRPI